MLQNRDISWLGFNLNVLQEASNGALPLFERMKFLSIFSSNLDEFFRVRYPAVVTMSKLNNKLKAKASMDSADDLAEKIQVEVNHHLEEFGRILTKEIIPLLEENGIVFYYNTPIKEAQKKEIKEIFFCKILAFLQPVFLSGNDSHHFLPENNQLYFVATLQESNSTTLKQSIVNIPSNNIQRFFTLEPLDGKDHVIFIDDIIRENISFLYPNIDIVSVHSFKFNRDAELNLEDEYSGNLLNKIEKNLKKRDIGLPSRFLYEDKMPHHIQLFLANAFSVQHEDMFAGGRYHHLSDLSAFPMFNKKLEFQKFKSLADNPIKGCGEIFKVLDVQDVLLHLPYQSYNPVLSFFSQAAVDATVTDIYITLYRLAPDSHIAHALMSAAKNGKNVVVFIELKARFDEANNIKWSRTMKAAGIKLVYSLPQIKVHSKIALVKKKIAGKKMAYAIISTGNFNEVTAKFYTDHVLMTSQIAIIKEMETLFSSLEHGYKHGSAEKIKFQELLVAQFNLIDELEKLINIEIKNAKKGLPALIRIKVNNFEEPNLIRLLYKANKAGVKIELIVRSICCITPGVVGISEHITVRRIVDRFLEHTRLFIFGEDNKAVVYMGSADLMTRNLYHRIEVCVPIKDATSKKELLDYFEMQWADTSKSVQLLSDYTHVRVEGNAEEKENAQSNIYEYLKKRI
jgi:polyphosphate kinase